MTVLELIQELLELPQDLEVFHIERETGYEEVTSVTEETVYAKGDFHFIPGSTAFIQETREVKGVVIR